jgi:hypothetical protein
MDTHTTSALQLRDFSSMSRHLHCYGRETQWPPLLLPEYSLAQLHTAPNGLKTVSSFRDSNTCFHCLEMSLVVFGVAA